MKLLNYLPATALVLMLTLVFGACNPFESFYDAGSQDKLRCYRDIDIAVSRQNRYGRSVYSVPKVPT